MSRRLAIADIHGSFKAMMQCFEASCFDYENDTLICLGDTCDGYPETKECFDELLKVNNLIYVIGNHDEWLFNWMLYGDNPVVWLTQGGFSTVESYGSLYDAPVEHAELLRKAYLYYELDNMLFVHGGIDVNQKDIRKQSKDTLLWDRKLIQTAMKKQLRNRDWNALDYDKIFIGHTTTRAFKFKKEPICEPIVACNVVNIDTGAGWGGRATIMNIDTLQYWQSDFSRNLYGPNQGRKI